MLISLVEIKKYLPDPLPVSDQELIELIGSRLVEIEEVIDLAPKYRESYIVKVVSAEKIPDTHLSLCKIDAGEAREELAEDGLIQVVCGAPNVHEGMLAVWLAPGAIAPSTYGGEDFKLGKRKLRGYDSNGMLAGADELGFDNEHKSIAEINPDMAKPGDSFAEVFELNDLILDVENKSLTHRPDCFGLIGFAREIAGILGLHFQEPTWPEIAKVHELPLSVEITDKELCPRYSCAVFDLPKHEKSKYLLYYNDVFLAKAGMRSIDPMVDLTNVIMLRTGQPLHAFDYDKLIAVGGTESPKIIVRAAQPDEELQLLDGKTIQCNPEDILITSNNIPVALAGAMGGKNTEIDASTKRVVLESATFSLYHLRKTQMAHGIFSEAVTRFTKGQPAAMTLPVLAETVAELGSSLQLLAVTDEWVADKSTVTVKVSTREINNLLGTNYNLDTIKTTLENVGFSVQILEKMPLEAILEPSDVAYAQTAVGARSKSRETFHAESDAFNALLEVTVPIWRTDIHIPEDIIEEVGRLLGYDNIALSLPEKPFIGSEIAPMFQFKHELRDILSANLQMNEVLTYSFVSRSLLEKVGQDPDQSYEIVNSISPELQCFRQQIAPSLLDKIRENLKSGHRDFTLYEMNQVTNKNWGLNDESTPIMQTDLGVVSLGDFYHLKAQILAMATKGLKMQIEYAQMTPNSKAAALYPYLEPVRSASITVNGELIGAFGEIKSAVLRRFKLDQPVAAAELNLDALMQLPRQIEADLKISRFPFVERDLTLRVARDAAFGRFYDKIEEVLAGHDLISEVTPVSIYQASAEDATKNISFHLKFSNPDKTLGQEEISAIMNAVNVEVVQLGATVV